MLNDKSDEDEMKEKEASLQQDARTQVWRQGMRLHPGSITVSILPPIPPATDHRVLVEQAQQSLTAEVANLNEA